MGFRNGTITALIVKSFSTEANVRLQMLFFRAAVYNRVVVIECGIDCYAFDKKSNGRWILEKALFFKS